MWPKSNSNHPVCFLDHGMGRNILDGEDVFIRFYLLLLDVFLEILA